jgi:indolepyruvate ferredoxin oxidoreductase
MQASIREAVGTDAAHFINATELARSLLGDAIAANLFLLGYAWQLGLIPVSFAALDRAIELNGTAVAMNRTAFLWGRRAAHDPTTVMALAKPKTAVPPAPTFAESFAQRIAFLTAYQDVAYADRYRSLVDKVGTAGYPALTDAVMRNLFKLMAIKDEYEVARLYAETDFLQKLDANFDGPWQLRFHLAPPLLARPDPKTGAIRKMTFGPWLLTAFKWLAKARRWRGTRWDMFGRSAERCLDRQLLAEYEADLHALLPRLNHENIALAIKLASLPDKIRGFGHVRQRSIEAALAERMTLRDQLLR